MAGLARDKEESQEAYKLRREMEKDLAGRLMRPRFLWNSSVKGTYRRDGKVIQPKKKGKV